MSDYRKLIHLPGTRLTPDVVLQRTLNKVDRIKAVAVVIQWDDETFDCDWSLMQVYELVMGSRILELHANREVLGTFEPAAEPEAS